MLGDAEEIGEFSGSEGLPDSGRPARAFDDIGRADGYQLIAGAVERGAEHFDAKISNGVWPFPRYSAFTQASNSVPLRLATEARDL